MFLVVILIFYKDPLKFQQVVSEPPLLLDYWELIFFFAIDWFVGIELFFCFVKKKCCFSVFLIMVFDDWLLTSSNRVLVCFTSFWIKFVFHVSCNANKLKEKHYYIFYLYNSDFLTWEQIKIKDDVKFFQFPRCIIQTLQT